MTSENKNLKEEKLQTWSTQQLREEKWVKKRKRLEKELKKRCYHSYCIRKKAKGSKWCKLCQNLYKIPEGKRPKYCTFCRWDDEK